MASRSPIGIAARCEPLLRNGFTSPGLSARRRSAPRKPPKFRAGTVGRAGGHACAAIHPWAGRAGACLARARQGWRPSPMVFAGAGSAARGRRGGLTTGQPVGAAGFEPARGKPPRDFKSLPATVSARPRPGTKPSPPAASQKVAPQPVGLPFLHRDGQPPGPGQLPPAPVDRRAPSAGRQADRREGRRPGGAAQSSRSCSRSAMRRS